MKRIFSYPATLYACIGLLMGGIVAMAGIQYDESGFRQAFFVVAEVFQLPFWVIEELGFSLNEGKAFPGMRVISLVLGALGCFAIDHFLLRKLFRTRSHRPRKK